MGTRSQRLAALALLSACNHAASAGFAEGTGGGGSALTSGRDELRGTTQTTCTGRCDGAQGADPWSTSAGASTAMGQESSDGAATEGHSTTSPGRNPLSTSTGVSSLTDAATDSTGSSTDTGDPNTTGGAMVASDPCGFALDGPWLQIAYNQAGGSPQSPNWSFSATPGWGAAQWASMGNGWPEVWDRWNNMAVTSDPIGVVAIIGPSSELQLMIGLEELISYESVSVCIEGRSVATSASVIFDVYNPLNGCGTNASMSNDWTVHAAALDLGQCLEPGSGVQAIRVAPSGGSNALGVQRMNVVLHGAVY